MIATAKRVTTQRYRHALAAAAGLAALALPAAFAFSDGVMNACADDYLSYCSTYDLDSPKVRQCMRSAGAKLPNLRQCSRCRWRGLQERGCALRKVSTEFSAQRTRFSTARSPARIAPAGL
jgi:hypothetical protein